MNASYRTRIGGLLRCCLQTIEDHMHVVTTEPKEGYMLPCKWCSGHMVFRQGAWQRASTPPPGTAA